MLTGVGVEGGVGVGGWGRGRGWVNKWW